MSVQHCYHCEEESGSNGFHSSYTELVLAIYHRVGQFITEPPKGWKEMVLFQMVIEQK